MNLILRKSSRAHGLVPMFRSATGSFGAGLAPASIVGALTSPLALLCVALALVAVALIADPTALLGLPFVPVMGSQKLKDWKQRRAQLTTESRAILDAAEKREAGQRELTAEEKAKYDAIFAERDTLRAQIEREERQLEAEREIATTHEASRETAPTTEPRSRIVKREFRTGKGGHIVGSREYRVGAGPTETPEYRAAFEAGLIWKNDRTKEEVRALQMDSDTAGGFTIAPQEFIADVIQAVDNRVFFRGLATVSQLSGAHSIGRPSLDADPADPTWVSELNIGSEDSTMAFGKRELTPHPLAQFIKVSRKLLRHSPIGPSAVVRDRLAYKQSVVQEAAYMTGTGAQRPLGVFTASNDGISTSRDVSTGNTTTSPTFDGLKEAKWTLKPEYWPRSQWIAHPDFGKTVDKLKDGEGRYIWQESVVVGAPDRLLGFPINFSQYAPNTFTTGLYVAILGDFANYWIVESLAMEIQQLNELYAGTNQVGFIIRSESDGMPVLQEAFVRVKLA